MSVVRVGRRWEYPMYTDESIEYIGNESIEIILISYPRNIDNLYHQIPYSKDNVNVNCYEYKLNSGDEICLVDNLFNYGLRVGNITYLITDSMYFDIRIPEGAIYKCSTNKWKKISNFGWSF